MAPTTTRRSGHSRRAQYGVFTGYVFAGAGALLGALLLAASLFKPDLMSAPRTAANDAVAPVAEANAVVRTESRGLIENVRGYLRAGRQNEALRKEVLAAAEAADDKAKSQNGKKAKKAQQEQGNA